MRNPFSIAIKYYLLLAFICALGCNNKPVETQTKSVKKEKYRHFFSVKKTIARKANTYKFNRVYKVTEFAYKYKNGVISDKLKTREDVYDTNGFLVQAKTYENNEVYDEKYTYTDEGRLEELKVYDKNDKIKESHEYNFSRNKSQHSYYDHYQKKTKDYKYLKTEHYSYYYDKHWNISIKHETWDPLSKKERIVESYFYDTESRIAKYEFTGKKDQRRVIEGNKIYTLKEEGEEKILKKITEYNDYGDIVKEVHYNNAYDKITRQETTTYYANGLPKVKEIKGRENKPDEAIFYYYEFYN